MLNVHGVSTRAEATTTLPPEGGHLHDPDAPTAIADDVGPKARLASHVEEADDPMVALAKPGKTLHFGPYRVQASDALLGKGGMGVVYRGKHAITSEVVAIKVVNEVSAGRLAAIRREIDALRRVSRHPGIVDFLESDKTDEGLPWVAMRFIEGVTLRKHIESLWLRRTGADAQENKRTITSNESREPSPRVRAPASQLGPTLTLIRRICAPLAFLHGEGLVHRDLKPENILIRPDGQPVLIDLGIAVHFGGTEGREELDAEPIIGTACYMAPEQIRGELVDARADLYALGCILYECVTGQPPFTVGNNTSIRRQHCSSEPVSPSIHAPGIPKELDALILKLLKKRPQDRIGYATDIARELVTLGAAAEPDEGPQPRTYLYRSELYGRTEPLNALKRAIHDAGQGRGGIALVHGESGVGKTRLVREVAQLALQMQDQSGQRFTVLRGTCVAEGAGGAGATAAGSPPLHPLRAVLVAAADLARSSKTEADRLFGPWAKVLSEYVPELRDLPGQAEQPKPTLLPPEKARERVLEALRETFWALAAASPLIIVLDDLQWADDLTLSLLTSLARAGFSERRLLIVGTYRSEETNPALDALGSKPDVTRIPLGRLEASDIRTTIEGMLARSAPETVLKALIARSNGNPFFIAQDLHLAIERGLLQRDEGGHFCFDALSRSAAFSSLPLPQALAKLIKRRLARLDTEWKTLVEWAAVLGQELDEEFLLAGTQSSSVVAEALAALKARQILEETEGGLRFVHDKIREIAYQRIPKAKRSDLHLRAVEKLKPRYASAPATAQAIGHHFDRARRYAEAAWYFTRAAEHARNVYANGDAIRSYKKAISALKRLKPADAHRLEFAELQVSLGDARMLFMRPKGASRAYRAALDATPSSDRIAVAELYRKIGKTWELRHAYEEAHKCYEQAEASLGLSPAQGSSEYATEWLQIRLDQISVHYWKAEIDPIRALVEEMRPVVTTRGSAVQRGHLSHVLTQRDIHLERFVPSERTLQHALGCVAEYEAAGEERDRHLLLDAQFNVAFVRMLKGMARGTLRRARAQMTVALCTAKQMGDLEVKARCLTYLTMIDRRCGRTDEVAKLARESLELARAANMRAYIGAALGNLAWVALSRGNHVEARHAGLKALARWKPRRPMSSSHVYPFQWLARLPLCFVASMQDRLKAAISHAEAVLDCKQQCLPNGLKAKLREAVNAFRLGHRIHAKRALVEALHEATKRGYT